MIRRALAALLVITGPTLAATAARAQIPEEEVSSIQQDLEQGREKLALKKLERALEVTKRPEQLAFLELLRALAYLQLKQEGEALAAVERGLSLGADHPEITDLAVRLGLGAGNVAVATKGMDRLVSAFPATARTRDVNYVYAFIRLVRDKRDEAAVDDYYARFAAIGMGEGLPQFRDGIAVRGARVSLARGDLEQARFLAGRINDAYWLHDLLTDRRMAALWPAVEARVEPHMAGAARAAVIEAEQSFRAEPAKARRRLELINAYMAAGRLADAEWIGAEVAKDAGEMQAIDEDGGWVINLHAMVLRAMRRPADAEARLAAMRALDIEQAPWLINMIINRAEFLVRDAHYAKASPLVDEATLLAEKHGNAYARQLLRRLKLCVAAGTGKPVAPLLDAARAHEQDAAMATAEGYLCAGRPDEAIRLVLAALADPDKASGAVSALQPPGSVSDRDPSVWRKPMNALLEDPRVASAFAKAGRVLPEAYWPGRAQ